MLQYDGYDLERGFYFWEIVSLTRKLSTIAILATASDAFQQAWTLLFAFVVYLCIHLYCRPYTNRLLNALETATLSALLIGQWFMVLLQHDPLRNEWAATYIAALYGATTAVLVLTMLPGTCTSCSRLLRKICPRSLTDRIAVTVALVGDAKDWGTAQLSSRMKREGRAGVTTKTTTAVLNTRQAPSEQASSNWKQAERLKSWAPVPGAAQVRTGRGLLSGTRLQMLQRSLAQTHREQTHVQDDA